MNKLTIYFPYYNQPKALEHNLKIYSQYSENIRKKIYLFIVDDGSLKYPALPIIKQKYRNKLNIILYRIDIDIPWNMPEANNLAFKEINTKYVLRTDIDHFIDEDNLNKLLKKKLELDSCFYKFMRKTTKNNNINSHPNTYIISKKNYNKIGGYNEYFSGNYGHDDKDFIQRLSKITTLLLLDDITMIVSTNFGTNGVKRDDSINRKKITNKNNPHLKLIHKDKYIKLL